MRKTSLRRVISSGKGDDRHFREILGHSLHGGNAFGVAHTIAKHNHPWRFGVRFAREPRYPNYHVDIETCGAKYGSSEVQKAAIFAANQYLPHILSNRTKFTYAGASNRSRRPYMDNDTRNAIEILANVLYLVEHEAEDATQVRFYIKEAASSMRHLQGLVGKWAHHEPTKR
jgi:hypothetical protein